MEKYNHAPHRIMIFGIPGSGKSTFAAWLGEQLQLPVQHMDKYFFTEGWIERDYQQFLQIQKNLVERDRWIIEGNATKSFEMRFQRADLVLYFRFNRLLCLWRIFKRLGFKDPSIDDRAGGCEEKVSWRLIRYLWGFDKRVKQQILNLRAKYPQTPFYELRNRQDLDKFIETLKKS